MERRERKITPERKPPHVTKTPEFIEAIEIYKDVLANCKVPTTQIEKQINRIQDPTTPRKKVIAFTELVKEINTSTRIDKK